MARVIALAQSVPSVPRTEWLRALVVSGCALALILAKAALPF